MNISHSIIKLLLFAIVIFMALTGCHKEQKFSTEKWDYGDGLNFPVRNAIVNDLVQHHRLKGLKFQQVVHLLKYPQYRDSVMFYYEIISTYTNKLKPDHIKNLVFYMGKDQVVTKVEIYDNKAKK